MKRDIRKEISEILIKWGMGTRQVAIIEIVRLFEKKPCCGHPCCCNYKENIINGIKTIREGGKNMGDKSPRKEKKKKKKKSKK